MLIKSHHVDIDTPTGKMRTYIHQPVITGKFPTILFYSEIFQQTGPIFRAAQIVASHGYNVLVPEVFHELNPIGTVLGLMMLDVKKVMQIRQIKMLNHMIVITTQLLTGQKNKIGIMVTLVQWDFVLAVI